MIAARVVEAKHSGFFPALLCVIGLAALSAGIDSLIGFAPLAMMVSALGGAALFAGILGTTLIRGFAVSILVVLLQFVLLALAALLGFGSVSVS